MLYDMEEKTNCEIGLKFFQNYIFFIHATATGCISKKSCKLNIPGALKLIENLKFNKFLFQSKACPLLSWELLQKFQSLDMPCYATFTDVL